MSGRAVEAGKDFWAQLQLRHPPTGGDLFKIFNLITLPEITGNYQDQ